MVFGFLLLRQQPIEQGFGQRDKDAATMAEATATARGVMKR